MANAGSRGFLASRKLLRSSTAFIVESLLLLVFLIGSLAVVTQLFVASIDMATRSLHLERAVAIAANTAERFSANPQGVAEHGAEGNLTVDCVVTPEKTDGGTLYNAVISVYDEDGELYTLHTSRYESGVS